MSDQVIINVTQAAKSAPATYTVPNSIEIEARAAFAHFDGSGASGAFYPALGFYSGAGLLLARTFPSTPLSGGDSADVTFAPFLGKTASQATSGPGLIYTTQLTVDTPSIVISAIPQVFRDLNLVCSARTDRGVAPDAVAVRFNGDSGANYDWQQISWPSNTAAMQLAAQFNQTIIWCGECSEATVGANQYGTLQAYVSHYTGTSNYKSLSGQFADNKFPAAVQVAGFTGGTWRSTAAITSVTVLPAAGANFKAGSQFSLYGL